MKMEKVCLPLDEIMGQLSEAMFNLKEEYPYKEEAQRAYGKLMGHLNYRPLNAVLHLEDGYVEKVF